MTSVELLEAVLDEIKGLRADMKTRPQAPSGAQTQRTGASGGGACFPNYGRSKGQPVAGATEVDLQYYAAGCRRTLADPDKARWYDKERALLETIEAEIRRQGGDTGQGSLAPSGNMGQQPDPTGNWGAEDDPPF